MLKQDGEGKGKKKKKKKTSAGVESKRQIKAVNTDKKLCLVLL